MSVYYSVWCFCLLAFVSGCTMNARNNFPANMKTKTEIYNEHFNQSAVNSKHEVGVRTYYEQEPDLNYSFIQYARIKSRKKFKRLPNPDLVLYVFPHVSGREQTPIPGYTTVFPMYTEIHYAMPGELPVNTEFKSLPVTPGLQKNSQLPNTVIQYQK